MNTTNLTSRSTLRPFALALVLGLLGATQAFAGEPSAVKVSYSDLNISTQAGAQTLYNRIAGAARTVCGYEGSSLLDKSVWRACYRDAIDEAVSKVNSPQLTAIHTGRPVSAVAMLHR
jgi:UrcA family protein